MSIIGFQALESALAEASAAAGAAECHGIVCGAVCAGAGTEAWLEELLPPQPADPAAVAACRALLKQLREEAQRALSDFGLELAPLMPEEDVPLARRVQALGEWCQGFLYGLGLGPARARLRTVPGDAGEVLRDLGELARAGMASIEGEGDETDEAAYAELVEYLRVGTQILYEELQRPVPPLSPTRH